MPYLDLSPAKILVVDDHQASRMTAAALLSVGGYQVIEADSGPAALQQVIEASPDLILLDVMMPGMNGYEVCQRIKRDDATRLIPVVFVTALNDRQARLRGIEAGGDDFLSKPFDQIELSARVKSLVHQKRLNEDLDHAEQVLFSIAQAVESRDPVTGDHCERLCALGRAFGEFLGLSALQLRNLEWAGYLHDIGKIGVPDSILMKQGSFNEAERQIMQSHVLIGEKICSPLRILQGVIPIIRHHHERWDGSGYPDGLAGEEIPLLARIFQLVDIYDALTSKRPYKPAYSSQSALEILQKEVQNGWRDPQLVKTFANFVETHDLRAIAATQRPKAIHREDAPSTSLELQPSLSQLSSPTTALDSAESYCSKQAPSATVESHSKPRYTPRGR
ncbi:MAG: two-component system response regulator [Cyanobacteria bacterium P01_D01_bin.128]